MYEPEISKQIPLKRKRAPSNSMQRRPMQYLRLSLPTSDFIHPRPDGLHDRALARGLLGAFHAERYACCFGEGFVYASVFACRAFCRSWRLVSHPFNSSRVPPSLVPPIPVEKESENTPTYPNTSTRESSPRQQVRGCSRSSSSRAARAPRRCAPRPRPRPRLASRAGRISALPALV